MSSRKTFLTRAAAAASTLTLSVPGRGIGAPLNFAALPECWPEFLPSKNELWRWESFMNGLGDRHAGSRAHTYFVDTLAEQFERIGCTVGRDRFTFPFWEGGRTGIEVHGQGGDPNVDLKVSGYWRLSTQTVDAGNGGVTGTKVTAPLAYVGTFPNLDFSAAAGKIAYFDYPLTPFAYFPPAAGAFWSTLQATYPAGIAFPPPGFRPPPLPLPAGTVANAANAGFGTIGFTLPAGVLGLIAGWTNISEGNALYQNFGVDLWGRPLGVPGLWVGPGAGNELRAKAKVGATVTMTLESKVTPNTPTETIYAVLPGTSTSEYVLVNTHSDGVNFTEENGALALFGLARYLSRFPKSARKRTFVFVMVTGHLTPAIYGPIWENAGFIADHPDIVAKCVAGLTVEHLGAMEWADTAALQYEPTGLVEMALTNTPPLPGKTTSEVAKLFYDALVEEGHDDRVALLAGSRFLGLGAQFYAAGIPMIGHIPVPNYLVATPPDGYIGKFNVDHMYHQIAVFARVLQKLDATSAAVLKGT